MAYENGKAYCSNGANSNLDPSNYDAFAQFVVKCSEHFIDEGYNVTEVSPINEPEWAWAADTNGNAGQEGSHWEDTAARDFYNNAMIPAIKKVKSLTAESALTFGNVLSLITQHILTVFLIICSHHQVFS